MAKKDQLFAIVDIETTGGRASRDKITEIGIVLHDGQQIVKTYETLINPQAYIPANIIRLTGINEDMVKDAPLFHEVARDIVEMTAGAIFVAHNVRFDYGFLREEFKRLGYTYTRKQLCTVRMLRKTFPGLKSYSLGNLIQHYGIKVDARHRALADALATTQLLEMVLAQENNHASVKELVNMGIKESRLPNGIKLETIHTLPETCGVYYLHGLDGSIVYVGKSINIKKRIAEHFADQTDKGRAMQKEVADISYEETGSELIALLLESQEIKRLHPRINRAQRRTKFPYLIHTYTNKAGYICFDVARNNALNRERYEVISEYPSMSRAKGRLNYLVSKLELCSRYCHLHAGSGPCFHYHLKQCKGACAGQESPEEYNLRATESIERLRTVFDQDFLLIDEGRNPEERSVVLVEQGSFAGFGYIDVDAAGSKEVLLEAIKRYPSYPDTARIIQRFLNDKPSIRIIEL